MELLPFFLLRSLYAPPDGPDSVRAAVNDALSEYLLTAPGGYGTISAILLLKTRPAYRLVSQTRRHHRQRPT